MDQVSLYYFNHRANVQPRHVSKNAIPYFDLTIVLQGVLYYVNDDRITPLNVGDFILIRPGEIRQRLDSTIPSEYVSFNFLTDMDLSAIPTVSTDALNAKMNVLLSACSGFQHSENALDKISYLLGALLLLIRDNVYNSKINPLALEIKHYILENYTERITLQEISERFHFSVSYCNSVFKKEMQKPIVDFLIEERMRKAKELMTYTDLALPEIALRVGYEDYNYFSRLFKKSTHFTPTQYRGRFAGK